MGESTRSHGKTVSDNEDPEQIRREIEDTRQELGETAAALAEKANIKAQAKRKAEATKASISEKREAVVDRRKEASPDGAASASSTLSVKARENPTPVAAGAAFATGLLIGVIAKRKR